MAFTDIAAPRAAKTASGTGISFGLRFTKGRGGVARLTFNEEVQKIVFGGPVGGKRFHAQAGRGSDEGRLRLVVTPDGEIEAKPGIKGSVSLSMATWDLLPRDARPAGSCKVHSRPSNVEVILELPAWSRPSGVGGWMEAEHGLKRQTTGRTPPKPGARK